MKYEFTGETMILPNSITLNRIRSLVRFGNVKAGEIGGWIEKGNNLSQNGNAWVYGDARVYGDAQVSGNARVFGDVDIIWISHIGSRNRTITFFASKNQVIYVSCGCFSGNIDEFTKRVIEVHGDNAHGRAYKLAVELAKLRIPGAD